MSETMVQAETALSGLPDSPYKGLMPYTEEDAAFFFGREAERDIIIANLRSWRLTLLYGESGVGKSSVLRAEVAHFLRELSHDNLVANEYPELTVVVFSAWRDDPVVGLTQAVEDAVSRAWDGKTFPPLPASANLSQVLRAWTERLDGELYIILDQFEEYFLYHPQEDGEGTFAIEFPRVIKTPGLPVNFIISIREDALAKLDRFKGRIPELFDNYLRLEHLDEEAARSAIVEPLAEYNRRLPPGGKSVNIEPALVNAVLQQTETGLVKIGESGGDVAVSENAPIPLQRSEKTHIETPYLQLVMTRLWEEEQNKGSNSLRLSTLEELGGAEQIVRTHLDKVMSGLSEDEQTIAAKAFRFLVTSSGTKITHAVPDLAEFVEEPESKLSPVLEKLASSGIRILRPVDPPIDQPGTDRYEIFHDVLAAAILDWRERYNTKLKELEQERLKQEELLEQARKVEEQRRNERERARKRQLFIFRILSGVLLVLLIVAVVSSINSVYQATQAEQQREEAKKSEATAVAAGATAVVAQKAAEKAQQDSETQRKIANAQAISLQSGVVRARDPELALLFAIEASKSYTGTAVEAALRQSLAAYPLKATYTGNQDRVNMVSFSPDGKYVITASYDKTVRIWDVNTNKLVYTLTGHQAEVNTAIFSPDSSNVLTSSNDGTARIWSMSDGKEIRSITTNTANVTSAIYSPDGTTIATWYTDNKIDLWNAASGSNIATLTGHSGPINTVSFSPDSKQLLTTSQDNTTRIWEVATGKEVQMLQQQSEVTTNAVGLFRVSKKEASVNSAAFSPDGKFVVTAGSDNTAKLWEVSTGQVKTVFDHSGPVYTAYFNSTGTTIITASADQTVRIWDVATGKDIHDFVHSDAIGKAFFSKDDKLILTISNDRIARVWLPFGEKPVTELRGLYSGTDSAAFSPDGKLVVTANASDNSARLWLSTNGQSKFDLPHNSVVKSIRYSTDGNLLVTASADKEARIWDATNGTLKYELLGHTGIVNMAIFSPDGRYVATASADKTARLWNVADGKELFNLKTHTEAVTYLAFSSDNKWLVTASDDKTARLWEVATGKEVAVLSGHTGKIVQVAFNADNSLIVTASTDNTAKVWETASGKELLTLSGHTDALTSACFSPVGKTIVTTSLDKTARIWDGATGKELRKLAEHTDAVLNGVFTKDGKQLLTASADKTLKIWNLATGKSRLTLIGHGEKVTNAYFSPDDRFIVSSSTDNTGRVWTVDSGNLLYELSGDTDDVNDVAFSPPDERYVVSASSDGNAHIYQCVLCGQVPELLKLAKERVNRELTTEERDQLGLLQAEIIPASSQGTTAAPATTLEVLPTPTPAPTEVATPTPIPFTPTPIIGLFPTFTNTPRVFATTPTDVATDTPVVSTPNPNVDIQVTPNTLTFAPGQTQLSVQVSNKGNVAKSWKISTPSVLLRFSVVEGTIQPNTSFTLVVSLANPNLTPQPISAPFNVVTDSTTTAVTVTIQPTPLATAVFNPITSKSLPDLLTISLVINLQQGAKAPDHADIFASYTDTFGGSPKEVLIGKGTASNNFTVSWDTSDLPPQSNISIRGTLCFTADNSVCNPIPAVSGLSVALSSALTVSQNFTANKTLSAAITFGVETPDASLDHVTIFGNFKSAANATPARTTILTLKPAGWSGTWNPSALPPQSGISIDAFACFSSDESTCVSIASFSGLSVSVGAPASLTILGGATQSATVGTAFATPLQVVVKDANGNAVSGVAVSFVAPPGAPELASCVLNGSGSVATDGSGVASTTCVANTLVGSYAVTATVAGLPPVSFNLTNTAIVLAPPQIVAGSSQSTLVNTNFAAPLQVRLLNSAGNPQPNITVTFAVIAQLGGPGATFMGGSSTATISTNAVGVAISPVLIANVKAGSFTVNATATNAGIATFNLTNLPDVSASMVITTASTQSAIIGSQYTYPLSVLVRDRYNNPIPNVTVAFSPPPTGASVSFAGGITGQTDANGQVAKTVTANTTSGSFNVKATESQTKLSVSFNLTNLNPPPVITSHNPIAISKLGGPTTLTIIGTGFIPSSVVTLGGTTLQITNVTPNQITCALNLNALPLGTFQLLVTNPGPGGGTGDGGIVSIIP